MAPRCNPDRTAPTPIATVPARTPRPINPNSRSVTLPAGLPKLTEGRTSIIIAHRLQTIQECDQVLVLHHGVVQEYGTHDELMDKQGLYYTLHELQFQDSTVAAELMGEDAEQQEIEGMHRPGWARDAEEEEEIEPKLDPDDSEFS